MNTYTEVIYKDYVSNKYFKIIDENRKELRIPHNRYKLNKMIITDRIDKAYIIFQFDNIYKSIAENNKKCLKKYPNKTRKYITHSLGNTELKKRSLNNYLLYPDRWFGRRFLDQFNRLFKTGVSIDLTHKHGGDHNEHLLFHIGKDCKFAVKWMCKLFGIPYQAQIIDYFGRYIYFDASGCDVNSLQFLHELFEEVGEHGSQGLELYRNSRIMFIRKDGEVLYNKFKDAQNGANQTGFLRLKWFNGWLYAHNQKYNLREQKLPSRFVLRNRFEENQIYFSLLFEDIKDIRFVSYNDG